MLGERVSGPFHRRLLAVKAVKTGAPSLKVRLSHLIVAEGG